MNEIDILEQCRENPVLFVETRLKEKVIEKEQIQLLNAIANYKRVSARSGHGIGKTRGIAQVAIWWLFTHKNSEVIFTAPTYRQIVDIIWKELSKLLNQSELKSFVNIYQNRIEMIGYEKEYHILGRSCRIPENFQGFHSKYLLFIVDEASGVNNDIGEVIEGALTEKYNKLLMTGNPTQTSGMFYDSFNKYRDLYKCLHFNSEKSNRVSKSYIENMRRKYGQDSDIYRVRVLGDFPTGSPDCFIPLWIAEKAAMNEVTPTDEDNYYIGVDPARYGDDESVIYYRNGYKVFEPITFHGINTKRLAEKISELVRNIRQKGHEDIIEVRIDETGLGAGVVDNLNVPEIKRELNIEVIGCNNGAKPENEKDYYNLGAEIWGQMKNVLPMCQIPNDEMTIGQISGRRYKPDMKGRIQLEKKEDMKKRGLTSPDRADALGLCLSSYAYSFPIAEDFSIEDDYINNDRGY